MSTLPAIQPYPYGPVDLTWIPELGCMFHKDAGHCPNYPSMAYYSVEGDIWCHEGLDEFRTEIKCDDAIRIA